MENLCPNLLNFTKQDKEVAAITTSRKKVGNPLFERLVPLRRLII